VHPRVKPETVAPVEATGIDYLRLLETAHQREVGQAINFGALFDEPRTDNTAGPG
jgi:putative transposase